MCFKLDQALAQMNANEVIANLATKFSGLVLILTMTNMSQSSNDVIPTAIKVSAF